MSRSMSASYSEYFGGPTLITKQAFLTSIPLAIMLVAQRILVSLFLNLTMIYLFSVMVMSIFFPSSYFLAEMMPSVRGLRYSASSEVKSEAWISVRVL